jgi:phosphoribosylformylglycinamidine synthase
LHKILGVEFSPAPYFNLDEEYNLHQIIKDLIKSKLIQSAHDVSEGGLFVTLAESAFNKELGFCVNQVKSDIRQDAYWFGEAQGRAGCPSCMHDAPLAGKNYTDNFKIIFSAYEDNLQIK